MLNTHSIKYYLFYDVFLKNGDVYAIGPYYPKIHFPNSVPNLEYNSTVVCGEFIPDRDKHTMLYKFTIPTGSLVSNTVIITYCHMSMTVVLEPEKSIAKHVLSISTVVKNEHDHLQQWLDYNIKIGVDHFYIYDNNSDDKERLRSILESYEKNGYVTLIDWSFPFKVYVPEVFPIPLDSVYFNQIVALNHCIHKYGKESEWIINMDPDEYMVPKLTTNMKTLIQQHALDDICGLYLYDFVFGPNNNIEETNTVRRFVNRATKESQWLCGGKVITKPENVTFAELHVVTNGNNKHLQLVPPQVLSINHYHYNKDRRYRFGNDAQYPIVDTTALDLSLTLTKKNIITIKDFGTWARLGNQMFQYAYLRSIALKHNCQIKLPRLTSPFGYPQAQFFDAFDIEIDVLDEIKMTEITETSMTVNNELHTNNIKINNDTMFAGYFQSEKYFKQYEKIIRSDFVFKESIRAKCDPFMKNIRSAYKQVVAMHVRRSDNLSAGSPMILISDSFRNKSVKYMNNKIGEYHLIIFTDDKEWCRKNLHYPNQTLAEGFSDLEDMYLMSLCDHFIIGSSSFSWWSAWLSTNKDKIVLIPDKWFKPTLAYGKPLCDQEEDLIPSNWVRLTDCIAPPMKQMNIITGEKIQLLCDHFIGRQVDFDFNPKIKGDSRCLDIKDIPDKFDNSYLVYAYTHILWESSFYKKLATFKNKFQLVLHNSDGELTEQYLKRLKEIPNLEKIYSQNVRVKDDMIVPLPIGIANSMWGHGNLSLWENIQEEKKIGLVHFNFSIETNLSVRQPCYDKINSKGIPFLGRQNQTNYLKILRGYKYAICPDGGGVDTHRLWECLYSRVIPICQRSVSVEYFAQYYPIVILDDWSDLNIEELERKYDEYSDWSNIDNLDFNHLKNEITLSKTVYDVVFPYHYKDSSVLEKSIRSVRENAINCGTIYIVGNKEPAFDYKEEKLGIVFIPEDVYPFTIQDVLDRHTTPYPGWYLQQLLKLLAFKYIPNLSKNYLVMDSDTILQKKTGFIGKGEILLYNTGTEYYVPYFAHMTSLHQDFKRYTTVSGICHHMMFDSDILREIIDKVEAKHNGPFWDTFLTLISDPADHGCSEYELYFNYVSHFYPRKIKIRPLKYMDSNYKHFDANFNSDHDYINYHCRDYF